MSFRPMMKRQKPSLRKRVGRAVGKTALQVGILATMLLPTEAFILFYRLANPVGFWQNLAFGAIGMSFIGVVQIMLIVFGVAASAVLWTEM